MYDPVDGSWDYIIVPNITKHKPVKTVNNSFDHKEKGFLTLVKQGRRVTKHRRYNDANRSPGRGKDRT